MESDRIEEFSQERLGGRAVPEDLRILLRLVEQGRRSPLDDTGVKLLAPGEVNPMLDTGYLNERDRADPDIMANVAAIAAVAAHIGTVARHEDGDAIGYWFHPAESANQRARLVRWDNEGQFSLMDGDTFAEAVVLEWFWDEDDDEAREQVSDLVREFAEVGIDISAPCAADVDGLPAHVPVAVHPSRLHRQIYAEERLKRGLES